MLAIIGGSGLTVLSNMNVVRREIARTPYGEPSGPLTFGELCGKNIVFLPRHGHGYTIPPHTVNYRANIWALKEAGVTGIISVASVGGVRDDLVPGDIVIPHQIIDYTWGRASTFFDGKDGSVRQVDFTEPYDADLRRQIVSAALAIEVKVKEGAVYAAIQGPRLETAAEIVRFARDGADLVGMTGMPEAVLAREKNIPYAAINLVTNDAAGLRSSLNRVTQEDIQIILRSRMEVVRSIIQRMVGCPCSV
jgi:5'-deoxy-5'-methylthioadenosine phosphorylase